MKEKYRTHAIQILHAIRDKAKANGLSHREIGEAAGISQSNVHRILNAVYIPRLDTYFKLKEVIES